MFGYTCTIENLPKVHEANVGLNLYALPLLFPSLSSIAI